MRRGSDVQTTRRGSALVLHFSAQCSLLKREAGVHYAEHRLSFAHQSGIQLFFVSASASIINQNKHSDLLPWDQGVSLNKVNSSRLDMEPQRSVKPHITCSRKATTSGEGCWLVYDHTSDPPHWAVAMRSGWCNTLPKHISTSALKSVLVIPGRGRVGQILSLRNVLCSC